MDNPHSYRIEEMANEDLNPDSIESCEIEIPDEGDVGDGIGLKCMAHPSGADGVALESPEYLKAVIGEHIADADRREEKIELLNKMIVDMDKEVMGARDKIIKLETKIAKLIKQKDYYKQYFPQQQEMRCEKNRKRLDHNPT